MKRRRRPISFSSSSDDDSSNLDALMRQCEEENANHAEATSDPDDPDPNPAGGVPSSVVVGGRNVMVRYGTIYSVERDRYVHTLRARQRPWEFFGDPSLRIHQRAAVDPTSVFLFCVNPAVSEECWSVVTLAESDDRNFFVVAQSNNKPVRRRLKETNEKQATSPDVDKGYEQSEIKHHNGPGCSARIQDPFFARRVRCTLSNVAELSSGCRTQRTAVKARGTIATLVDPFYGTPFIVSLDKLLDGQHSLQLYNGHGSAVVGKIFVEPRVGQESVSFSGLTSVFTTGSYLLVLVSASAVFRAHIRWTERVVHMLMQSKESPVLLRAWVETITLESLGVLRRFRPLGGQVVVDQWCDAENASNALLTVAKDNWISAHRVLARDDCIIALTQVSCVKLHRSVVTSSATIPPHTSCGIGGTLCGMRNGTIQLLSGSVRKHTMDSIERHHHAQVICVKACRDSFQFASIGSDTTVKVWDMRKFLNAREPVCVAHEGNNYATVLTHSMSLNETLFAVSAGAGNCIVGNWRCSVANEGSHLQRIAHPSFQPAGTLVLSMQSVEQAHLFSTSSPPAHAGDDMHYFHTPLHCTSKSNPLTNHQVRGKI